MVAGLIGITPPAVRVGIAYDVGGTHDHGLNERTAAGVRRAVRTLRFGKPLQLGASAGESDTAKVKRLRLLAGRGYNPVVAVGYAYGPAVRKVAAEFPRVKFALVDDESSTSGRNVTQLVFAENEQGFLAGAMAARKSATKHIGFLGGVEDPMVMRYQAGFVAGVRAVDPLVAQETLYLTPPRDFSGFNDPKKGEYAAEGLIGRGVDVIFDVTGHSGSGVRRAAVKAGIGVIGSDVDVARRVPKSEAVVVFASAVKRADVAVFDYLRHFAAGKVKRGKVVYGIKSGGVGVTGNWPALDELKKKVSSGVIKVPGRR